MAGRRPTVSALPAHGDVIVGRDRAGRVLRVSSHPESDRVVLSVWQGGECMATFRLASADVPHLVHALMHAAAEIPSQAV